MDIYTDVLSDDLIKSTLEDAQATSSKTVWEKSGAVLPSEIYPTELHQAMEEYLAQYFLETSARSISYSYFAWKVGSNLVMHRDESYAFSATLYLNKYWHPDWGGLFVWKDKDAESLKVLCPKQNMLAVNNKHEEHMITPITEFAKHDRLTIQIRGQI